MNMLSAYSDIIQRQADEARAADKAVLDEAEAALPAFIASLPTMSKEELLERYFVYRSRSHSFNMRKRRRALNRYCAYRVKRELLGRIP